MSGSVLYLGRRGPLYKILKEDIESRGGQLSCPSPGEVHQEPDSGGRVGKLVRLFKGFSLIVLGRGGGAISLAHCVSALEEAGVPGLLIEDDAFALAQILETGGQAKRVPIVVVGGLLPGLGHALLNHLVDAGVVPGKISFLYELTGLGALSKEGLRGAFGRRTMGITSGVAQSLGAFSPGISKGSLSYPSGELGALLGPASRMNSTLSAESRLWVASKRVRGGLMALGALPGHVLLGTPGSTPDPEMFLTGSGGDFLERLSPKGERLGISVTVEGKVRRASCRLEGGDALAGSALCVLKDMLLGWRVPMKVVSPLDSAISKALWAGLEARGIERPAIVDAAHSVDPRLARRLHILAA